MALDLTILSNDLDFIINDMPITISINGNEYIASKAQLDLNISYNEDGIDNIYDFSVYLNKNSLISADIPAVHSIVVYDGVSYRVLDITKSIDDQLLTVHLGREYA